MEIVVLVMVCILIAIGKYIFLKCDGILQMMYQ